MPFAFSDPPTKLGLREHGYSGLEISAPEEGRNASIRNSVIPLNAS